MAVTLIVAGPRAAHDDRAMPRSAQAADARPNCAIAHRNPCTLVAMEARLARDAGSGLERLCESAIAIGRIGPGRVRYGSGAAGIERLEARFAGQAYSPHRHDTYAIGITLAGVQSFRYRGERRQCLPGEAHILHPDETHDGGAGTERGFRLPDHLHRPVARAAGARRQVSAVRCRAGDRRSASCLSELVRGAAGHRRGDRRARPGRDRRLDRRHARDSSGGRRAAGPLDIAALSRVRDLIAGEPASAARAGTSWSECRVSIAGRSPGSSAPPSAPARCASAPCGGSIACAVCSGGGAGPAEASIAAGFADQSHMSRHFKRAYGVTPSRWVSMSA